MTSENDTDSLFAMEGRVDVFATTPDAPLATRMRPRNLDEFVGQQHILGAGKALRRAIERDDISSLLLWGPPGCGKSTLAQIVARSTKSYFENYSAVTSGVADVRKVIQIARDRKLRWQKKTILFVDEIHRWNKAQQDALLPHVEDGTVTLIGATTENPFFEVIAPLLSRARLFRFEPLSDADIRDLLLRAVADRDRGLGAMQVILEEEALEHLVLVAGGDARNALNALETAALATQPDENGDRRITIGLAEEGAQTRKLGYDKQADEHYDTISAFIKSVRGSDPDAAIYWLAKMLVAGEDIRFIARRLVILASEDIGNADPMGLVVANSAAQAVMFVGMPEAQLILAQATAYLAAAHKSNAAYLAVNRALEEIRKHGAKAVPVHLRDSNSVGGRTLRKAGSYLYPHDYPNHYVEQEYLPEGVQGLPFYEPTLQGTEARIFQRMQERKKSGETNEEGREA